MKKVRKLCLLVTALLIFSLMVLPAAATQQSDTNDQIQYNQTTLLGSSQLITNAKAVVLYEYTTDTFMYSWNADTPMYPSSMVKILTALLAVQKGDLSEIITVRQDVLSTVAYDAVSADLLDGEQLTLEQLLYCMMVGSANDAAAVIADHIANSQDAFVQEMNTYAQSLGCTNTVFTNVHGLHDPNQHTTARDMAQIVADAMNNEVFREIFGAARYTVSATNLSEKRELSNNNLLLDTGSYYFDGRVTGGRTGVTEDGDRCVAATAEDNGMQVVSIIMGSKSVYEEDGYTVRSHGGFDETKALLDIGLSGYKAVGILYPGQALKQLSVNNGNANVTLTPATESASIVPVNANAEDLTFQYRYRNEQQNAPIEKGQVLGDVSVYYNGICVAETELLALNEVAVITQQLPVQESAGDGWAIAGKILIILAALAILIFAVRFAVRKILIRNAAKRSRRYRRSRRRSR